MLFKKYSDFIAKGNRPFWKHKEYLKYLKTLLEYQAIDYEIGLIKFIKNKGINSYDRTFLKKLRYTLLSNHIVYLNGGNFRYNKHSISDTLDLLHDKYFTEEHRIGFSVFKYFFNYKRWDNGLKGDEKRTIMTVNKMKFKDHSNEFEFLMEFQKTFLSINNFNYNNPTAAKYIFNVTDISLSETTILMYLKRRKRGDY